ncbi:hypothetical protein RUND412_007411 [Rhizina undulata]
MLSSDLKYEDLWEVVGESERERPKENPKRLGRRSRLRELPNKADDDANKLQKFWTMIVTIVSFESVSVHGQKDKKAKGLIILNTYHPRMTQMCLKTYRPTYRDKVVFSHSQKKPSWYRSNSATWLTI